MWFWYQSCAAASSDSLKQAAASTNACSHCGRAQMAGPSSTSQQPKSNNKQAAWGRPAWFTAESAGPPGDVGVLQRGHLIFVQLHFTQQFEKSGRKKLTGSSLMRDQRAPPFTVGGGGGRGRREEEEEGEEEEVSELDNDGKWLVSYHLDSRVICC